MGKKRPRKASLRGWWHALPFLLSAFAVFFLFTWLEAQRLKNEYRANALVSEIWEVRARIQKLQEQSHYLNRMERMDRQAPSLELIEANPDQIVLVRAGEERVHTPKTNVKDARARTARPTRTVIFDFDLPPAPTRTDPLEAIAQAVGSTAEQSGD